MPDIAMCVDKTCTNRKKCYRYVAVPKKLAQTYSDFKQKSGSCDFFWRMNAQQRKDLRDRIGGLE